MIKRISLALSQASRQISCPCSNTHQVMQNIKNSSSSGHIAHDPDTVELQNAERQAFTLSLSLSLSFFHKWYTYPYNYVGLYTYILKPCVMCIYSCGNGVELLSDVILLRPPIKFELSFPAFFPQLMCVCVLLI